MNNKDIRKDNKKRALITIVVLLAVLAAIYNLVWYMNWKTYKLPQNEAYETMPKGSFREDENYVYTFKAPNYLNLTGNYAIWDKDDDVTLIIWPGLFHKEAPNYGIEMTSEGKEFRFYIDSNLNYKKSKDMNYNVREVKEIKSMIYKYSETIENLMEAAKSEWIF